MDLDEAISMMARARDEIKMLRNINAQLAPKADAYDKLSMVLDLLPKPSFGQSEDMVWRLDKRIAELVHAVNTRAEPDTEPCVPVQ